MKRILILFPVAPIEPYPRLFAMGPLQNWLCDLDNYAYFLTYSGQQLGPGRKVVTDLRDALRFPGVSPATIGTIDSRSSLIRLYSWLTLSYRATPISVEAAKKSPIRFPVDSALFAILWGANKVCEVGSLISGRVFGSALAREVTQSGIHLSSARSATMTNHLRIQQDVVAYILGKNPPDGIIFATPSVYLRWSNVRKWVEDLSPSTNFASVPIRGSRDEWSYGGTLTYFSKAGAEKLISNRDFHYGLLQDRALGNWIRPQKELWSEMVVKTFSSFSEKFRPGKSFPEELLGVICTNYSARSEESIAMQVLSRYP